MPKDTQEEIMKKWAIALGFVMTLGMTSPLLSQTTRITNMEYVEQFKKEVARQDKSNGVFSVIGSVIGLGLIIWFIISRFTRKKKD